MLPDRSRSILMGTHVLVASLFLCALIVEWGAHNLLFAHAGPGSGLVAVSKTAPGHDDPCGIVPCHECRRSDPAPAPNSTHLVPPCSMIDVAAAPDRGNVGALESPPIPRRGTRRIFRAVDPPHQPPELS
jgi:hypothetical protein